MAKYNIHDRECLSHILENSYPNETANMFKINIKESIVCESLPGVMDIVCNKRIEIDETTSLLCIDVADTKEQQRFF